jgi:hypothetical protein
MSTFEQMSFGFSSSRALDTASKAKKLTQELRRRETSANRMARLLPPTEDEDARQDLERRIALHLPVGRLALAITDNRYTMISVRRDKGPVYRVRLHHMFCEAPQSVTSALARYIAVNCADASRELSKHIEEHQARIRRASRRQPLPITVETLGEIFDLQKVFDELNDHYFAGQIEARITWGTRGGKRRRRTSIKMGSYSVEDRLIRIHPALDRKFIPKYFLEWIVYHEMLHQVHDIPIVDGRRQFHTAEFFEQERQFEHYEKARDWERRNLDRILHF